MRIIFVIAILLFIKPVITAQTACMPDDRHFIAGEKLTYTVSYNWGIIWINAGEVDFDASLTSYGSDTALHFFSTGHSFRRWDWLFKVRDTFEAYSHYKNLQPLFSRRHTLEGGFRINNRYHFNPDEQSVFAELEETRTPYNTHEISLPACTYDVLTATYVARSLPFSNYSQGDTIRLSLLLDGKTFELPIVIRGEERIKNRDGRKWDCILFSAVLDRGSMFRAGEELLVWVSKDDTRLPIMMEAKITVGSIKIYLSEAEYFKTSQK
ncbi:MAG: DUF3108 domain-containing protein [Bacteroidales bacterium]|jgi:hypothetical protein|nr:DUF3108 domain-containing protein [Bacteroidales bacterium]HOI31464.1 DUF3108 domain-containing protein [Bacteroidales bacterium]